MTGGGNSVFILIVGNDSAFMEQNMFKAKKETTILCGLAILVASFMGCSDSASANDVDEAEQGESISSSVSGESVPSAQNVPGSSGAGDAVPGLSSNVQSSSSNGAMGGTSSVSQGGQNPSQGSSSSSKKAESSAAKRPSDFNGLTREDFLNDEIEYLEFEDERDHQKYKYVKIGSLYWMSQSLNYSDSVNFKSLVGGKSFCYNDNPSNCDVAGRLYTWAAAIDSVKIDTDKGTYYRCGLNAKNCTLSATSIIQGVCPEGWRLPNDNDWVAMYVTVYQENGGYPKTVGRYLRAKVGWDGGEYTKESLDSYGFSAIPGGEKEYISSLNYNFKDIQSRVLFWSVSPEKENTNEAGGINRAHYLGLMAVTDDTGNGIGASKIPGGHYVRCVKDVEEP